MSELVSRVAPVWLIVFTVKLATFVYSAKWATILKEVIVQLAAPLLLTASFVWMAPSARSAIQVTRQSLVEANVKAAPRSPTQPPGRVPATSTAPWGPS